MNEIQNFTNKFGEIYTVVQKMNSRLREVSCTGEAGAGLVRITCNGHREVLKVEVDASLLQPGSKHVLEDLLVAAVNNSFKEVEEILREELGRSAAAD